MSGVEFVSLRRDILSCPSSSLHSKTAPTFPNDSASVSSTATLSGAKKEKKKIAISVLLCEESKMTTIGLFE